MKPSLIGLIIALVVGLMLGFGGNALYAQDNAAGYSSAPPEPATADPSEAADSQNDQVLEIPQAAATDDQADTQTQSDAQAQDDADIADSGASPGDANDYANQSVANNPPPELSYSAPAVIFPPVVAYLAAPVGSYAPYVPPNIIVTRPGGLNSIPATSPMLTTPRGSHPVLGGWWQRAHR